MKAGTVTERTLAEQGSGPSQNLVRAREKFGVGIQRCDPAELYPSLWLRHPLEDFGHLFGGIGP
jgi:hypothetical protein